MQILSYLDLKLLLMENILSDFSYERNIGTLATFLKDVGVNAAYA